MKVQFDANQDFQLDAINAAVDLFKGQPVGASTARRFYVGKGIRWKKG